MTENERLSILDRKVTKSNDLIQRSRFNLSLQQQKIMLYLISQITPYDTDFKEYTFVIKEFCQVCGIDDNNGKNYANLKAAVLGIKNKSFFIDDPNAPDDICYTLDWIEKARISRKNGTIKIKLDADMKPYLLQLKDNFTSYELIYTLHFKSKYTIRLYEIIKSIHFHDLETYVRTYTIEELRTMLEAENYKKYDDFRKRVLDPSVREINEYSDKVLSYEPIRQGRAIGQIKFTIGTKDATERLRIHSIIENDFGFEQLSLFDKIEGTER